MQQNNLPSKAAMPQNVLDAARTVGGNADFHLRGLDCMKIRQPATRFAFPSFRGRRGTSVSRGE